MMKLSKTIKEEILIVICGAVAAGESYDMREKFIWCHKTHVFEI